MPIIIFSNFSPKSLSAKPANLPTSPVLSLISLSKTGTATFGAEEASLADYDDIDDFNGSGDGITFNPPINSARSTLTGFDSYSQQVTVKNANPANLQQDIGDHGSDFVRITVTIIYGSTEICSDSWIRARY